MKNLGCIVLMFISAGAFNYALANENFVAEALIQKMPKFDYVTFNYIENTTLKWQNNPNSDIWETLRAKIFSSVEYNMKNANFKLKEERYLRDDKNKYYFEATRTVINEKGKRTILILNRGSDLCYLPEKSTEPLRDFKVEGKFATISYFPSFPPDVSYAWMEINSSLDMPVFYADFIKNLKFKRIEEKGAKYIFFPDTGFYFNADTFLLSRIDTIYSKDGSDNYRLYRRVSFLEYGDVNNRFFPKRVLLEEFDDNGTELKSSEFVIDLKTLRFNSSKNDAYKIAFPNGTHVSNEITGKSYIVDDSPKNQKKEDIMVEMLENTLKKMQPLNQPISNGKK